MQAPLWARGVATDPRLAGFEDFVSRQLKTWGVPGAAVAVVKDGKVVFAKGFGYRNLAGHQEVTPDTLFNIGSTAKAFTAMSVGQLVDAGKLEWDAPVRRYLPSFRLADPVATEKMTPRDLLSHRSGLPSHDVAWLSANGSPTRQELMQRLQYLEPNREFRTRFQYSNLSYLVASELVAKVSQMSWERWVETRIFAPLGMTSSNLSEERTRHRADFAVPYGHDTDFRPVSPAVETYGHVVPLFFQSYENCGGCASIYSSVTDMAQWLLLHLEGGRSGGQQIISAPALREMHSPQMLIRSDDQSPQLLMPKGYEEAPFEAYGLGWFISSYRGHPLLWHTGGAMGLSAMVSLMPDKRLGIVVLTNMHRTSLRRIVTFNAYDRLLGRDVLPWNERFSKEELARAPMQIDTGLSGAGMEVPAGYAGSYFNSGYGMLVVGMDQHGLYAIKNGYTTRFRPDSAGGFVGEYAEVAGLALWNADFQMAGLVFSEEGGVRHVTLKGQSPEDPDVEFLRVPESEPH